MVKALRCVGYATFSMIVLYWTKNVVLATFLDVFLLLSGGTLLTVFNHLRVIKFLHLENYVFEGILINANASLQLGLTSAWGWIIFAIARICIFSIVVSFLLFRKKELDF